MQQQVPVAALSAGASDARTMLVVAAGAPPWADLVAALLRDRVDLTMLTVEDWQARAPEPERPIVLLWLPAGAPSLLLADAVAWKVRAGAQVALIGCAPEGSAADSERALAEGFDDFVAGRYSPRELAARVRALARRLARTPMAEGDRIRFGRVTLDLARHELWVDGRVVALTVLEMTVMRSLVSGRGRAMSRTELLDRVWGDDDLDVGLRAVDNLILRLRRKIGVPDVIVTVRGVGFRIADA